MRGPEQSRSPEEIEAEVRRLAEQARRCGVCLEVTLLGQTVNSYRYRSSAPGCGGKTVDLADLLYRLHDVEGLDRLKYVSNCPRHMTQRLVDAVAALLPLGVPVRQLTRLTRLPVEEFTTVDRFDGPPLAGPAMDGG